MVDMANLINTHEAIAKPFLALLDHNRLAGVDAPARVDLFAAGGPEEENLAWLLERMDEQNVSHLLNFIIPNVPFAPIADPMLQAASDLLTPRDFSNACLLALSAMISEWEVGESCMANDSLALAKMLHSHAEKMPKSTALAIARIAGQHHRRGASAGVQPALEWLVERFAVNPSPADEDRNVWHEAIMLAISTSRSGMVQEDFAVFDEMPIEFIQKMSTRHSPTDPLTTNPQSLARFLVSSVTAAATPDMVELLQQHCGSLAGLRKALSISQSQSLQDRTTGASPAFSSPRL